MVRERSGHTQATIVLYRIQCNTFALEPTWQGSSIHMWPISVVSAITQSGGLSDAKGSVRPMSDRMGKDTIGTDWVVGVGNGSSI